MMEQSTTNLNFWGSSTAAYDIRKKFQKCYYLPLVAHLVEQLITDSHFEGFESTNDRKKIPKMRVRVNQRLYFLLSAKGLPLHPCYVSVLPAGGEGGVRLRNGKYVDVSKK